MNYKIKFINNQIIGSNKVIFKLEKPPLIISPPPMPSTLRSFLVARSSNLTTQENNEFDLKCLNLKELIRNLTIQQKTSTYDYLGASKAENEKLNEYYLQTQFLLNFIFIPLFMLLVVIFLLIGFYYLFNR